MTDSRAELRVVVMLSGEGTTLQAILDASDGRSYRVCGVISDRPRVPGLKRAARAAVPTAVVDFATFAGNRAAFDRALIDAVERFAPGLVVLAGFMRILGPTFVGHYRGRLVNIHPSLLPKYKGLDTYRRVLAAGDAHHGTSVHFVTEELDGGPVIAQAAVAVRPGDDAASLSARVQARERRLYPEVLDWFGRGRVVYRDGAAWLDGRRLDTPQRVQLETS